MSWSDQVYLDPAHALGPVSMTLMNANVIFNRMLQLRQGHACLGPCMRPLCCLHVSYSGVVQHGTWSVNVNVKSHLLSHLRATYPNVRDFIVGIHVHTLLVFAIITSAVAIRVRHQHGFDSSLRPKPRRSHDRKPSRHNLLLVPWRK